jgi:hypothetical protein
MRKRQTDAEDSLLRGGAALTGLVIAALALVLEATGKDVGRARRRPSAWCWRLAFILGFQSRRLLLGWRRTWTRTAIVDARRLPRRGSIGAVNVVLGSWRARLEASGEELGTDAIRLCG